MACHSARSWGIFVPVYILIMCLATPVATAEEQVSTSLSAPRRSFIKTEARFVNEINLLHTGRARIFPPAIYLTESDKFGPEEGLTLLNRNTIEMGFVGRYAEVRFNVYTLHSQLIYAPEAIGLESTVLFPLPFISQRLLAGIYHDSAHNLDTGAYGAHGSDMTGWHLVYRALDDPRLSLDTWFTRSMHQRKKSPYFVTAEAKNFTQTSLEDFGNEIGGILTAREGGDTFRITARFRSSEASPSSVSSFSLEMRFDRMLFENLSLGAFAQYHENFKFEDNLGRSEWLIGPRVIWGF